MPVEIPWQQLSDDALAGVIEEFVSREGTEYGLEDVPFATKIAQVQRQLERGEVMIFFDPDTASCQLLTKAAAHEMLQLQQENRDEH